MFRRKKQKYFECSYMRALFGMFRRQIVNCTESPFASTRCVLGTFGARRYGSALVSLLFTYPAAGLRPFKFASSVVHEQSIK